MKTAAIKTLEAVSKPPARRRAADEGRGQGATTSSIVLKYGEEERRRPAAFRRKQRPREVLKQLLPWLSVVLVPLWAGPSPAASLSPAPPLVFRDLFAEATDTHFWIAHVVKNPDGITEQTVLLWRPKVASNGDWIEMPVISDRVISIASSGGELLVVLKNGQWQIADETDVRTGPSPPIGLAMLAVANDQDDVWGIVRKSAEYADTEPAADTTQPTTKPSAPIVSAPPTQPSGPQLFLCRFTNGQWVDPQPLPDGVGENPAQLSFAVVGQVPMLAWRAADEQLYFSKFDSGRGWSPAARIAGPAGAGDFKLLAIQSRPALWLSSPPAPNSSTTQPSYTGVGEVRLGSNFSDRIRLPMPTTLPSNIGSQTLVEAYGNLRWIAYAGDQQIEQDFSLQAFPDSFPAAKMSVVESAKPAVIPLTPWMAGDALLIVLAAIAAVRQRTSSPFAPIDEAEVRRRLAPLSPRFIAGMVDLAPIVAVVAMIHPASTTNALGNVDPASLESLFELALATYLLHTLAAELICGQSIGKIIFGLRVVTPTGAAPGVIAILIRNLSRVIDISVAPLMLIPLSPLRQRVGDILATTVVIAREGEGDAEE